MPRDEHSFELGRKAGEAGLTLYSVDPFDVRDESSLKEGWRAGRETYFREMRNAAR
jgi:hypothetical protein